MTTDSDQWRRVGAWLMQRRIDLGYKQRTAWARLVSRPKFGTRVIIDMESGARANYGDDAITAAEDAYQIDPGTLRQALAGDIPEPRPVSPPGAPEMVVEDHELDTPIGRVAYQVIRDLNAADWMPPEKRAEIERALADRIRSDAEWLVESLRAQTEAASSDPERSGSQES